MTHPTSNALTFNDQCEISGSQRQDSLGINPAIWEVVPEQKKLHVK
jgi:hypothetical protein